MSGKKKHLKLPPSLSKYDPGEMLGLHAKRARWYHSVVPWLFRIFIFGKMHGFF